MGRLTQAEVAKKLGVSGVKAHRLIARATQEGAVKFVIDGDIAECVAASPALRNTFLFLLTLKLSVCMLPRHAAAGKN